MKTELKQAPSQAIFIIKNNLTNQVKHTVDVKVNQERIGIDQILSVDACDVYNLIDALESGLELINTDIKLCEKQSKNNEV